jgi:hypothetical protein
MQLYHVQLADPCPSALFLRVVPSSVLLCSYLSLDTFLLLFVNIYVLSAVNRLQAAPTATGWLKRRGGRSVFRVKQAIMTTFWSKELVWTGWKRSSLAISRSQLNPVLIPRTRPSTRFLRKPLSRSGFLQSSGSNQALILPA